MGNDCDKCGLDVDECRCDLLEHFKEIENRLETLEAFMHWVLGDSMKK